MSCRMEMNIDGISSLCAVTEWRVFRRKAQLVLEGIDLYAVRHGVASLLPRTRMKCIPVYVAFERVSEPTHSLLRLCAPSV